MAVTVIRLIMRVIVRLVVIMVMMVMVIVVIMVSIEMVLMNLRMTMVMGMPVQASDQQGHADRYYQQARNRFEPGIKLLRYNVAGGK